MHQISASLAKSSSLGKCGNQCAAAAREDTAARMEIFTETDSVQAVFSSASDRPSMSKCWASSYYTSVPE
jgi:hypothetical protein